MFSFIILEMFFRFLYPDPSPKLVNQALQTNDTYGIAFTPNTAGWNTSLRGEYSTYITINSKGLRGEEHEYQKDADVFRILVLGDSFTAGLQVNDDELFTSLLEERLNEIPLDKSIEVINAGVVGYGTTNELTYFIDEGYKYQPDIVLLMFFTGNDVLDNINPPHYKLENDQLIPIKFTYNPDFGTPPWAQDGTLFRKTRNFLYTHSRLYSVAIELLAYSLIQQSPQLSNSLQSMGFVEVTRPAMNAGNLYSFLQPSQEAWEMTNALIIELNKQVHSHDSKLIIAVIPDETEVNVKKWEELYDKYPNLFNSTGEYSNPSDQVTQLLNQDAIPHLLLRPPLKTYQQNHENEPIYYQYDGHWKPIGHYLVAQAIGDYIIDEEEWSSDK